MVAKFYNKAPYLYFTAIWLSIGFPGIILGNPKSFFVILFTIPFVYQWIFERKGLNLVLGVLKVMWSLWMLMAYLSDALKIGHTDPQAWKFLLIGGLIVILNFLMTGKLFSNARIHAATAENTQSNTSF